VTICIAARSLRDECIVAICDKMLSYDDFVPATEGAAEKAFWIHRDWYAMMAGDPSLAFPVIRRVPKSLAEKEAGSKITLDEMTAWFRNAFQAQLQQDVEDRFLGVYEMTLAAFKRDGFQMLGLQEFATLNEALRFFNLGIQFLVFGLEAGRFGHIFEVSDPNGSLITEHDLKGYAAIDSGFHMAMGYLVAIRCHTCQSSN
jgi:20S proteasome alpha/beta subunit